MTSGAFIFQGGPLDPIATKITSSTVVNIAGNANSKVKVPWFSIQENAGSTPNLTVELYDGTTSIYLGSGGVTWKAKAVTANQSIEFTNGLILNVGQYLRVTSSDAAGKFDVTGMSGLVLST